MTDNPAAWPDLGKAVISELSNSNNGESLDHAKEDRLSSASIARTVIEAIEHIFGESTTALMRVNFPAYGVSFDDNSIVDKPERFTEAIFYTFGSAADLIFDAINKSLMLYAPINPADDMTESGSAGFVFLIYKIKETYDLCT
jgi:hypothetical protein